MKNFFKIISYCLCLRENKFKALWFLKLRKKNIFFSKKIDKKNIFLMKKLPKKNGFFWSFFDPKLGARGRRRAQRIIIIQMNFYKKNQKLIIIIYYFSPKYSPHLISLSHINKKFSMPEWKGSMLVQDGESKGNTKLA